MLEQIEFEGLRVDANSLMRNRIRTSWPDIYSTDINGSALRWQFANASGPCAERDADRLLIPFAQGRLAIGTALRLRA